MNRPFLLVSAALLCIVTPIALGGVIISAPAPESEIILFDDVGGTFSRIFDEDSNPNHARGQLPYLPTFPREGCQITGATIHKKGAQTFSNDTLTVRLIAGTQTDRETGSGHDSPTDGADYSVTPRNISFIKGASGNPNFHAVLEMILNCAVAPEAVERPPGGPLRLFPEGFVAHRTRMFIHVRFPPRPEKKCSCRENPGYRRCPYDRRFRYPRDRSLGASQSQDPAWRRDGRRGHAPPQLLHREPGLPVLSLRF